MKVQELRLQGAKLLSPTLYQDQRGFFLEAYQLKNYEKVGICPFVQDNHSYSKKETLRGLHFQPGQAKLVRVVVGMIYDVIVDIRPESPTFGQWEAIYLDEKNHCQLYIPHGFAHGFCALTDEAHVLYKVSTFYDPQKERSIRFNDPDFAIQWPVKHPLLSKRDETAPFFRDIT